jgi:hypothetical protein
MASFFEPNPFPFRKKSLGLMNLLFPEGKKTGRGNQGKL